MDVATAIKYMRSLVVHCVILFAAGFNFLISRLRKSIARIYVACWHQTVIIIRNPLALYIPSTYSITEYYLMYKTRHGCAPAYETTGRSENRHLSPHANYADCSIPSGILAI